MMSFRKFISFVKRNLGTYPSEDAVKTSVILPILQYLGWNTHDHRYVYPEYPLNSLKVDYALNISEESETPQCIIEAKAEGKLDAADQQLFQYAFFAGAPLAVLTDGKLWMFYLPINEGSVEERLVRTLDFEKHNSGEIIKGLVRYLSFENMCSGKAVKNANRDRREEIKRKEANKNIHVAWKKLLDGSSDKLIILLIEEASQISSGFAPAKEDVETFLRNLGSVDEKKSKVLPKAGPKPPPKTKKGLFSLFGEKHCLDNPTVAFAKILEILAKRDQYFLEQLAQKTAGKKHQVLSQNKEDFSPVGKNSAKKLPNGWWVSTHSSTGVGGVGELIADELKHWLSCFSTLEETG